MIKTPSIRYLVSALAVIALALALAACGGSSSASTTSPTAASANANASATTPGSPAGAGGLARFRAFRECLTKNGVTLPRRPSGQQPGGFLGGGSPTGFNRAQYEAAAKKCGGPPAGRFRGHFAGRPANKQALSEFAACMRNNGVNLPEPNTSGKGAIFDTKGLNPQSASFRTAEGKCVADLRAAFSPAGANATG